MKALKYRLRLKAPLLATQTQSGESNSSTTSLFIPGSMMRGAVIARLPQMERNKLATDSALRQTYLHGGARFLNAYPAHPITNQRLLPKPLSWRVPKDLAKNHTAQIFDFALKPAQIHKPKSPSAGEFVWLENDKAALYSPRQDITVHNASDDRDRKQAELSQVYRYDALAEGEVFVGVILGDDAALNAIQPLLTGNLALGGSRTGGYGLTEIFQAEIQENWNEYTSSGSAPANRLILTLLSDVIVRGADGNFQVTLDEVFGAKHQEAFAGLHVVGGFNRKWGLPLTQAWAIAAGSVFVYAASDVKPDKLMQALADGIGERRGEGFGCIAQNWHTRETWVQVDPGYRSPSIDVEPLTDVSVSLAQRMASRQLRTLLDERLTATVVGAKLSHLAASPSQLSRVRLAAREALFKRSLQPVIDHLDSLYDQNTHKAKIGARQLEETRVNGETLIEWLRAYTKKPDLIKEFSLNKDDLPKVARQVAALDAELQAEYVARLIDGVLKRAIKDIQAAQQGVAR